MADVIQLWQFPGGIHPPERKSLANQSPIRHLPVPQTLYIPLRQHIGLAGDLIVAVGERVRRGQALTEPGLQGAVPVHAPTSGIVKEITQHPSNHPSAIPEPTLVLESDGEHESITFARLEDPHQRSTQELLAHIQKAGIAGLGGAAFPTAQKLRQPQHVDVLIINGAECEPYIVSDDRLMREHAETIVQGIQLLQQIIGRPEAIIAIEDNKPEAIQAMSDAVAGYSHMRVQVIPTLYPSGGEKQLIQILTGKQVPATGYPADIGILMHNTGTAYAVARAVYHGEPLLERVVTLTGEALREPGTAWVLLGTPVAHVLEHAGLVPGPQQRIIMGGPMMGFTIADTRIPIIKSTNCILAPTAQELPAAATEMPCIRCGHCEQVCPASLLPQQLQWLAKAKDYDGLKEHHLADCIECGACAYVCPSEIPLVHYYRKAKAEIREQVIEQQKADIARQRFEARQARLEREKQERLEKHKKAAEAREKALAERAATATRPAVDAQDPVKAAVARAKARKAALQQADAQTVQQQAHADTASADQTPAQQSPQQARVAAAIARAKAKKAAATKQDDSES